MTHLEWKDAGTIAKNEPRWFWIASTSLLSGLIIGFIIGKIII